METGKYAGKWVVLFFRKRIDPWRVFVQNDFAFFPLPVSSENNPISAIKKAEEEANTLITSAKEEAKQLVKIAEEAAQKKEEEKRESVRNQVQSELQSEKKKVQTSFHGDQENITREAQSIRDHALQHKEKATTRILDQFLSLFAR